MALPVPKTATATDSPDNSVTDDASAVLLSESPAAGEIWYVEGAWVISDGAGSDLAGDTDYVVGTAIWPTEATDAEIGSQNPTANSATRAANQTNLGTDLATATDGAWKTIGDLIHPNEKAVLNVNVDNGSSSSTLTFRSIARRVA